MEINGKEVKAQIWDTAGQEWFPTVTLAYYRSVIGALVVYNISRRTSFESIHRWLDELNTHSDTTIVRMLVGNKCDLENIRDVSVEEGKALAEGMEEGEFSEACEDLAALKHKPTLRNASTDTTLLYPRQLLEDLQEALLKKFING